MSAQRYEAIKTDIAIAFEKRLPVQATTSTGDVVGYVFLGPDRETHFGLSMYSALPPVNVEMFAYTEVAALDLLFRFPGQ